MATQQFGAKLAYTKDQLHLYLKRINFFKDGELQDHQIPANYDTLERITRGHTNSISFGNLSYIYHKKLQKPEGNYPCDIYDPYTTQGVSPDLQDIFKKLVLEERDGACIENNPLCAHMLMTLGFNAYLTSSNNVETNTWDKSGTIELRANLHCGVIVELDGKEYYLDVGVIIGRTPKPILMEDGYIQQANPLTEYRISRTPYPDSVIQSTNPKHFPWLLECKTKKLPNIPINRRNDWFPVTYINMSPVYQKDIQVMNDICGSLEVSKVFRSSILMSIDTDEGYIILKNKDLKICTSNGVECIQLNSEKERREAYLKYFNTKVPKDHNECLPRSISKNAYTNISHLSAKL
jgi:arylamine N-acetyltransferase